MRFMTLVIAAEGQGLPPPSLFEAIAQLERDARKAGVFVSQGGLAPTATGTRVRLSKGHISVDLKSKEEALEWTRRFMELHKQHWPGFEGATEVRQMFEPLSA